MQASAVLTAVLADPAWAPLIDTSRIAVIGHSAGGYTALALAGGRPEVARVVEHCRPGGAGEREDAAMCALRVPPPAGAVAQALPAARRRAEQAASALADPRIRAVVALAPLGVVFDPAQLAAVALPVHLEYGQRDELLAPRFHGLALCRALPQAECVASDGAGHFASFQTGTGPMPTAAGDPASDPSGFDCAAWQAQALPRVLRFLDLALNGRR
jgi:predicted dienelactone hydrolase